VKLYHINRSSGRVHSVRTDLFSSIKENGYSCRPESLKLDRQSALNFRSTRVLDRTPKLKIAVLKKARTTACAPGECRRSTDVVYALLLLLLLTLTCLRTVFVRCCFVSLERFGSCCFSALRSTDSESKRPLSNDTSKEVTFPLHQQNVILDNGLTYVLDRSVAVQSIVIQNSGTFLYYCNIIIFNEHTESRLVQLPVTSQCFS